MALGLQACDEASQHSGTISRASTANFDIGDLPNPKRWDRDAMWRYFFTGTPSEVNKRMHAKGYPTRYTQNLVTSTEEACDTIAPPRPGASSSTNEKYYREKLADLPRFSECFIKTGPTLVEHRIAELAYLNEILSEMDSATPPQWMPAGRPSKSERESTRKALTIDSELKTFERAVKALPKKAESYRRFIAAYGGLAKESRESWATAWNQAVNEFAQDNPYIRPGPGQSGSNLTLTTDMISNTSPGVRAALVNLDVNGGAILVHGSVGVVPSRAA
ncbi:hypothetical protein [Shimia abyssi]|nr:hypothetical protein [Shimia abyssi]